MFSDNRQLVGDNPMYENLVKSLENYDYAASDAWRAGFVNYDNLEDMRKTADSDLSNPDNYRKLHSIMNMKPDEMTGAEVYMKDSEAVDRHKCMMFGNTFSKRQWDVAFSVTDVFYFNEEFSRKRDFIYAHAEKYINCFGQLLAEELKHGNLSYDTLTGKDPKKWVGYMDFAKTNNPDLYDNPDLMYYGETVRFIGDEILKFRERWEYSLATCVTRLRDFILCVSEDIVNPYYKQKYVFGF